MLNPYIRLMRLDKPIGILLLFWPVAWAMILTRPSVFYMMIFTVGVVLMRTAGCIANDIADRKLDKWVTRTQDRPLTCGEIPVSHAVILLVILLALSASLLLFLNTLCFILALFALALTLIYPLCKRFMQVPQVMLGITFNMGVLMVYAQTQNNLSEQALCLYTAAALWTIAFDTLYAMADKADDLKVGIKSSAIWFGEHDFDITCVIYAGFLMNLILVAITLDRSYWLLLLWLLPFLFIVNLLWKVYSRREAVFQAFLSNHWLGLMVALVFGLIVLFKPTLAG
jgi:4-hydroxybenzoate polyprenyltransferase